MREWKDSEHNKAKGPAYRVGDLELLALADVGGLGDGSLQAGQSLGVERLCERKDELANSVRFKSLPVCCNIGFQGTYNPETHLSAGDNHLDLAAGSRDNLAKLLRNALQEAQSVVLGEGFEEVLERGAAGTGLLDELGHDRRPVGGGQGGRGEDDIELGVLLDKGAQLGELLGGGIEGGRLGGRGVLEIDARISQQFFGRVGV